MTVLGFIIFYYNKLSHKQIDCVGNVNCNEDKALDAVKPLFSKSKDNDPH